MLREMEKVFENLKEEFNRKISTDSFISYFVKPSDVSREGSSSDSFEDISADVSALGIVNSTRNSIDEEGSKVQHDPINMSDNKEQRLESEELNECEQRVTSSFEKNVNYSYNRSFEEPSNPSLNVINEEEVNELCRQVDAPLQDPDKDEFIGISDDDWPNTQPVADNNDDLVMVQSISSLPKSAERNDVDITLGIVKPQKLRKSHVSASVPNNVKKQFLHRMMWSEMPEVIDSGLLTTLPRKKIQLQEAMFEIVASEASYYQSLMILTSHFFESDLFKPSESTKDRLVSSIDKHHIFSNVILIMYTSQNFLNDLDKRWREEKPMMREICDIILKHASGDDFQNYVTYLRNQEYQRKALKRLSEHEAFKQQLHRLETSSVCGKLSIDSYLMLPMQRLTRLKLLIEALLKLLVCDELRDTVTDEHVDIAEMTLEKIKQLLDTSDLEKGIMDQKSMLMLLMNKMDFPANFKRITISDKVFIKEVDVRVHYQSSPKHIRKFSKKRQPIINLILFNDLLIIAKKKGTRLVVLDYCDRDKVEVAETKFKSIASSADISGNLSTNDFPDCPDDVRKMSVSSLVRSKTSMSPEDWKKFNSSLANSFRSMSLTSRNDEREIVDTSFSLRFVSSQTDIFTTPLVLLTSNKDLRDEWIFLLGKTNTNDGRLHKTTSLRINSYRKDDFRLTKNLLLYGKTNDGAL